MDLSSNGFSGVLPTSVGSLKALTYLSLGSNYFISPLPPSLFTLTSLQSLELYNNFGLTSTVPSQISGLTALTYLNLGWIGLQGTVPSALGTFGNMQGLFLPSNQLTGTIPPSITTLRQIRALDLSSNVLHGTIPSGLGSVSSLTNGWGSSCNNGKCWRSGLALQNNYLTGTVASSITALFRTGGDVKGSLLQLYDNCGLVINATKTLGTHCPVSMWPSPVPTITPSDPTWSPTAAPTNPTYTPSAVPTYLYPDGPALCAIAAANPSFTAIPTSMHSRV
jgi:Leucine-rich repeat (LRR) protein